MKTAKKDDKQGRDKTQAEKNSKKKPTHTHTPGQRNQKK